MCAVATAPFTIAYYIRVYADWKVRGIMSKSLKVWKVGDSQEFEKDVVPFNVEGLVNNHQLIKQFLVAFQKKALGQNIVGCLKHIGKWMNEYYLKLNESKTIILIMAPPSIQLHFKKVLKTFLMTRGDEYCCWLSRK